MRKIIFYYTKCIHQRLKDETSSKSDGSDDQWLFILKEYNFVLRASEASKLCNKLNIEHSKPAYYKDIKIRLPDVQWGEEAKPFCPSCKSNVHVGVHAW